MWLSEMKVSAVARLEPQALRKILRSRRGDRGLGTFAFQVVSLNERVRPARQRTELHFDERVVRVLQKAGEQNVDVPSDFVFGDLRVI
jgi:hypothetical protein